MNAILSLLNEDTAFAESLREVRANRHVLLSGLSDGLADMVAASLAAQTNKTLVLVVPTENAVASVCDNLQCYLSDGVVSFPAKDALFYQADRHGDATEEARLSTLQSLLLGHCRALVIPAEALLNRLCPKKVFESMQVVLRVGQTFAPEALAQRLRALGYARHDPVEHAGQFAVRGGIVDVFVPTAPSAYRIEFFDTEIDSIRTFDLTTQRSIDRKVEITLEPAREWMADAATLENAKARIHTETEHMVKKLRKKADDAADAEAAEQASLAIERLRQQEDAFLYRLGENESYALDAYSPFLYEEAATVLDYLPEETLIVFKEPARIREKIKSVTEAWTQSFSARLDQGYLLPTQGETFVDFADVLLKTEHWPSVSLCALLSSAQQLRTPDRLLSMQSRSANLILSDNNGMTADLKHFCEERYRVIVLCESELRLCGMAERLNDCGLTSCVYHEGEDVRSGVITLAQGMIHNGFADLGGRFVMLSGQQTTSYGAKKKVRRNFKNGKKIGSFNDLAIGDCVVHETHGIGIYQGLEQIEKDGAARDYFRIAYRDGGTLYVPTTSLDMLSKYVGGEDAKPKLNRLGSNEWQHTKARVREGVRELAENLVQIYASRQAKSGYVFSPDTVWQREFEDAFPFEETQDQINAIAEVKADMESSRIMDRLICGDVGYGKTEIALRAAFKAVQDGKQVAILTPTTVLAQQHYDTFCARMKDYPVTVELLSRFCTPSEISRALRDTQSGKADILIGTHRLLSKDVRFKDLGLLVVDEEQRFGVGHKERIKDIKRDVDVLTLTATPIPRTLHMSMSGIRDMSVLEEPPEERQPIQTFVMEQDDTLISEAIARELARGGQVFYLYNRVRGIEHEAARIRQMAPTARVRAAHGQMAEHALEDVMTEFVAGEIDVLVCTTIVENGLDIPNANTIIVANADTMGLAQLYQLRGRVGRSARLAYAYFLYPKDKVLAEAAEKRLEAIGEFTEFGSGFRIAMRDLQIRGAGNVLGPEQHGHMGAVGYELYCKMLTEAMATMKNEATAPSFETTMRVSLDAFIPSKYITNEAQKLEVYKKIALITDEEDYLEIQEELLDRYGDMPRSVGNLLEISLLKARAHALGIDLLEDTQELTAVNFREDAPIDPAKLLMLSTRWKRAKIAPKGRTVRVVLPKPETGMEKNTARILRLRRWMTELETVRANDREKA